MESLSFLIYNSLSEMLLVKIRMDQEHLHADRQIQHHKAIFRLEYARQLHMGGKRRHY